MSSLYFQVALLEGPLVSLLSKMYAAGTMSLLPLVVLLTNLRVSMFMSITIRNGWNIEKPLPSGNV